MGNYETILGISQYVFNWVCLFTLEMDQKLKLKYFLVFCLFSLSCSKVQTVNLKEHSFGRQPENIIWFQIAGLQEEHLAMLRFNLQNANKITSFEKATCLGKAWAFNLYDLRPDIKSSFLSQTMGSNNIKGSCEDFKQVPVWKRSNEKSYSVGIFEIGISEEESFVGSKRCEGRDDFWNDPTYWVMRPQVPGAKTFHYQEQVGIEQGDVYYDKSCKGKICFASPLVNIKKVWEKFVTKSGMKMFIVRDQSYLNALMKKDIAAAREMLDELEKIHFWFYENMKSRNNTLILVSSSNPREFEFPKEGKEWAEFEKSGNHIIFRNSGLISPVFASGASSENFCGVYNENEIGPRVFWKPKRKKIDIFNF